MKTKDVLKSLPKMTWEKWEEMWHKMPNLQKMELERLHGYPISDDNRETLKRQAALRAGLPVNTACSCRIIYALNNAAKIGEIPPEGYEIAAPKSFKKNLEERLKSDPPKQKRSFTTGQNPAECWALQMPIEAINTDPQRFQNRTDAFSELSAQEVANNYDPNKFDPIVIWSDQDQGGRLFVLSGHSRLEGMKRRKVKSIPARIFEGTEAEAIQFARVDANRLATEENLVEDLKAYKLVRDGDPAKGIEPAKKKDIQSAFKGKVNKLDALSYLDPSGLFIVALSQENKSEYPYLERYAQLAGEAREKWPEITNTMEADLFWFFYSQPGAQKAKINKEEVFAEVEKRLLTVAKKGGRLFPECGPDKCTNLGDVLKKPETRLAFDEIKKLEKTIEIFRARLKSNDINNKIWTPEERRIIIDQGNRIEEQIKRLRRDIGVIEAQPALFGVFED